MFVSLGVHVGFLPLSEVGVQSDWPHPYWQFFRFASPGEYLLPRSRTLSKDGDLIVEHLKRCNCFKLKTEEIRLLDIL